MKTIILFAILIALFPICLLGQSDSFQISVQDYNPDGYRSMVNGSNTIYVMQFEKLPGYQGLKKALDSKKARSLSKSDLEFIRDKYPDIFKKETKNYVLSFLCSKWQLKYPMLSKNDDIWSIADIQHDETYYGKGPATIFYIVPTDSVSTYLSKIDDVLNAQDEIVQDKKEEERLAKQKIRSLSNGLDYSYYFYYYHDNTSTNRHPKTDAFLNEHRISVSISEDGDTIKHINTNNEECDLGLKKSEDFYFKNGIFYSYEKKTFKNREELLVNYGVWVYVESSDVLRLKSDNGSFMYNKECHTFFDNKEVQPILNNVEQTKKKIIDSRDSLTLTAGDWEILKQAEILYKQMEKKAKNLEKTFFEEAKQANGWASLEKEKVLYKLTGVSDVSVSSEPCTKEGMILKDILQKRIKKQEMLKNQELVNELK